MAQRIELATDAEAILRANGSFQVSAVIPFFQRRPGVLAAAVRSALAQQDVAVSVIVVDDGSPISACHELAVLSEQERSLVTVIEQPNAGPGAARNRGLEALPDRSNVVAFLDSDDQWLPDHLANACAAFRAGADFYFSDYMPLGSQSSTFERCGLIPVESDKLRAGHALYVYGLDIFDALLRRSPVGTSTVAYRRATGGDIRFRTDFSFGEDVFFWMEVCQRAAKIVFSSRQEALYGAGVNIAAGAVWDTPQNLQRTYFDFALHEAVARKFALTPEQTHWNNLWMDEVARSFVSSLLHLLRCGRRIDWTVVGRFVYARPSLIREVIRISVATWWSRTRRLRR